jgi:cytoskeletal protein RodZ
MKKVSELLKQTREDQGINIVAVERETKIKRIYLEAIERGRFEKLPSESYALGFVKNYAKFLGLPLSEIVPLFRREYAAVHNVHIIPEFRKKQHVFSKNRLFSGRGLIILAAVVIIIVYIFVQYSSLIFAPGVDVISPKNNSSISGNVVEVKGKTDPYATVEINGDEVYVDLSGTFKKSVYEFSGQNKIKIVAKNRFGKQSEKDIVVNVE